MTALSFDLDPLATGIVALLRSPGNLNVHVGHVTDSDATTKTISAPLPYVRVNAGIGFAPFARTGGRAGHALRFRVSYTGATEDQTRAVALAVRELLRKAVVTAEGRNYRVRVGDADDVPITPDPVWNRPGGGPLYYGVDSFVAV